MCLIFWIRIQKSDIETKIKAFDFYQKVQA